MVHRDTPNNGTQNTGNRDEAKAEDEDENKNKNARLLRKLAERQKAKKTKK